MRPDLCCLLLNFALGCSVPALDPTGKLCAGPCPSTFTCQEGRCVGPDGRLCPLLADSPQLCLDFEGGTEVSQPTIIDRGVVKIDTSSRRFGTNSLETSLQGTGAIDSAHVVYPLARSWQRVRLDFDLFPELPAQVTGIGLSFAEVICSGVSYSGLWLFNAATSPPAFVARTGFDRETRLGTLIPGGEWTRVTMEVDRAALRGRVLTNGVESADVAVTECGGDWTVQVGMSGTIRGRAWYDDVVVRVDAP